ncbi:MAG: hypothetical protein ACREFJ_17990 [Acetobacteraceae bacterium]
MAGEDHCHCAEESFEHRDVGWAGEIAPDPEKEIAAGHGPEDAEQDIHHRSLAGLADGFGGDPADDRSEKSPRDDQHRAPLLATSRVGGQLRDSTIAISIQTRVIPGRRGIVRLLGRLFGGSLIRPVLNNATTQCLVAPRLED